MPTSFFSLPQHIKSAIVKKLDFTDFVNFHQSSLDCFRLAIKIRTRFTYSPKILTEWQPSGFCRQTSSQLLLEYRNKEIGMKFVLYPFSYYRPYSKNFCEFPIRFEEYDVVISAEFTEEFCTSFTEIVKCTNSTVNELTLDALNAVCCSPEAFSELIETAKIKQLLFYGPLSPEYTRMENMRKISKFYIGSFMNEPDILLLNARDITVLASNMTSAGFNLLIKRLFAEEYIPKRNFKIETTQQILRNVILDGIPNTAVFLPTNCLEENFIIGEGRNRFSLIIRDQTITLYEYHEIPSLLPIFGYPFGYFPVFPFGAFPNFPNWQ